MFPFISDVLRYSREFLLDCSKRPASKKLPEDWDKILLEHPYLEPKVADETNDDKPTPHERRLYNNDDEKVPPTFTRRPFNNNNNDKVSPTFTRRPSNSSHNSNSGSKQNLLVDPIRPNVPVKTWDPETNKWVEQGPPTRAWLPNPV